VQAVILAGGKGLRLKPFTTNIPKPLVPIDDLPILEIVLRQLKHHGFTEIVLAVNHLAELIMAFFGDGRKLGLNIVYSMEDQPLGTAGPLALVENLEPDFLVMNGDLLTTLNYRHLFEYHKTNKSDITISAYKKQVNIDLGVLETENDVFVNYIEKPTYTFNVSMGIYIMRKTVVELITRNQKMDLPDLVLASKKQGKKVLCYSGDYFWLDIGRIEDFETANKIFADRRKEFLPS
jgi:NDP-sugar pyrophosphorylase family protein